MWKIRRQGTSGRCGRKKEKKLGYKEEKSLK